MKPHSAKRIRRSVAMRTGLASVSCSVIFLAGIFLAGLLRAEESADPSKGLAPPRFRLRSDPYAASDAQALRDKLRYLVDAQGPINPLSDYGKRASNQTPSTQDSSAQDPVAAQAPTLDRQSAKRLQSSGLTLPSSTLGVMMLLPPPSLQGPPSLQAPSSQGFIQDDGFRPSSSVQQASSTTVFGMPDGAVRVANFYQDDPIANTPPSLNTPPIYGGGSLPGMIPGVPQIPPPSVPLGVPPNPVTNNPGTYVPGTSYTQNPVPTGSPTVNPTVNPAWIPNAYPGAIPPANMPSNAVPTTVMPAPPTYYVPAPISAPTAASGTFAQPGVPYAGSPMPSYNRAGAFVNSAPFVSAAPTAVDARWMVSPAVWQQGAGTSAIDCNPALASTVPPSPYGPATPPMGMVPGAVPGSMPVGVNGVTPTAGLVPPATATPFAYAPPAAMPPATIYAPSNGGFVPLVGFGQGSNAQLGRGLYGQPTAYVDGQPVRNFLRYIFP
jgi:hypothetical protein